MGTFFHPNIVRMTVPACRPNQIPALENLRPLNSSERRGPGSSPRWCEISSLRGVGCLRKRGEYFQLLEKTEIKLCKF